MILSGYIPGHIYYSKAIISQMALQYFVCPLL